MLCWKQRDAVLRERMSWKAGYFAVLHVFTCSSSKCRAGVGLKAQLALCVFLVPSPVVVAVLF